MGQIFIDEKEYKFSEGDTILDVAKRQGVDIPVLCYLKDITETGACRICLVEVLGVPVPVAACSTYANDGMKVFTNTENVVKHRLKALDFLLMKHPLECTNCENNGDCMLQSIAKKMGVSEVTEVAEKRNDNLDDWNMLWYNSSSCVACQRCVGVCNDVTGCNAIDMDIRNGETIVAPVSDDGLDCDFCGICADVCPVGAIIDKPFKYSVKIWGLSNINTSCAFCPVGCKINYGVHGGKVHKVRKSKDNYTCSKGRYGFKYIESDKRLKYPMIKRDGILTKTSWGNAFESIQNAINKYGVENSLIVAGSRLTNEELYNYYSLSVKTGMKFVTEAEFYFGSFMRAFKEKFGHFESRGNLKDLENSHTVFVIGADFARESVGLKWSVLKSAIKNDAKIITIGLQRYEYDEHTFASIIADYGDFAGIFEKIKNPQDSFYQSIYHCIESASNVSIVLGNEFFEAEENKESVFAFADFIGENKLKVFMPSNDKVNYVCALYAGGITADEAEKLNPKVVFALAVNPALGKLERLGKIIKNAEFYATPDLFITGSVENANLILPVQASIEGDGSYITIDGRLNVIKKVVDAPAGTKSNSEIAQAIAYLFRKKIDADHISVFKRHAEDFGFLPDDLEKTTDIYRRKEEIFNKTDYEYKQTEKVNKTVYVNPRHHEGALTRILETPQEDLNLPLFPDVEVIIKPGVQRFSIYAENIAKGINLVPRGK